MEVLFFALALGLIPASIARNKGRSFFGWWLFGAALFIIALPAALLLKSDSRAIEALAVAEGNRKCPFCAEMIKNEAIVCKHCGRDVPPVVVSNTHICPKCGYENTKIALVCVECGAWLGAQQ